MVLSLLILSTDNEGCIWPRLLLSDAGITKGFARTSSLCKVGLDLRGLAAFGLVLILSFGGEKSSEDQLLLLTPHH